MATDQFLKRERLHLENLNAKRFEYRYRERSIDDGSHYDPRLDKYPIKYRSDTMVIRERQRSPVVVVAPQPTPPLLGDIRKMAGLEKVYFFFMLL